MVTGSFTSVDKMSAGAGAMRRLERPDGVKFSGTSKPSVPAVGFITEGVEDPLPNCMSC